MRLLLLLAFIGITPLLHSTVPVDTNNQNIPKDTVKYWIISGKSALQINQIALSDWAKGGDNALSGKAGFLFNAKYEKNKVQFQSKVNLAYGTNWSEINKFRKTEDRIHISSMYGYKAYEKWYYSALLDIKTQFDKGFKYPDDSTIISQFFAPAHILLLPWEWKFNPSTSCRFLCHLHRANSHWSSTRN